MNKRTVLVVIALATFLVGFTGSSINIALPAIGTELNMDAVSLGWVATAYLLASASLLLPFGRLADIHGRKRIFACGLLVYTVSSLFLTFVSSSGMLIALRLIQGVGGAMVFSTSAALVTSVFVAGERGQALGISAAMIYLGMSLGPVLGGVLTQHFGWRSVFFVTVPFGVAVLALIVRKVKGEWTEARGKRFDLPGSLVYAGSLIAIIYGFPQLPDLTGIVLTVAGALGIFAFVRLERRTRQPLLNINVFRTNRLFAFSNLALLLNYSAAFAVSFLMSLYLQYIKGLTPEQAGLILVVMPAIQAAFSAVAGRLSDRIEPRILASMGMGLISVGLAMFSRLGAATDWGFIIGGLSVIGFGFALFVTPNTNAIMSSVNQKLYGVASATLATTRQIGMMFSLGIVMLLFAANIGRAEIVPQNYPLFQVSMRIAFMVFTGLSVVGIFVSLARGNIRGKG